LDVNNDVLFFILIFIRIYNMFKKTLIAAAVATIASTAAMADVSISGQVKVTVADNDTSDHAASLDNSLTFKSSEDLGNGLTGFAQITLDTDIDTDTTATGGTVSQGASNSASALTDATAATTGTIQKDAKVGIKGGFGTVVIGRMETLTEGAVSSMMDDGGSHGNLETGLTELGRYNAIAYVSPTVNGLHVAAAGTMDGTDSGMFKNTDVLVAYDNGPLSLKAARTSVEAGASDYDVTSLAASYKIGDLKLSALSVEKDVDGGTSERDNMYRADYSMGNNSILLGRIDDDTANSDITTIKLTHKFSKRTAVWIGHRDKGTAIAGGDTTHFGMIQKF
jgi:predicted porin